MNYAGLMPRVGDGLMPLVGLNGQGTRMKKYKSFFRKNFSAIIFPQ